LSEDGFGAQTAADQGAARPKPAVNVNCGCLLDHHDPDRPGAGHVTSALVIGPGRVAFWSIRHFAQTLSGFLGSVR
jgi:hypothetical protein